MPYDKAISLTLAEPPAAQSIWRKWELPTWGIAVVIYGGWILITLFHASIPLIVLIPLMGWFICWHGHLQHEVLHGHPTRTRWVNEALVYPSFGLWFPYGTYRDSHLSHHADWHLTCPVDDAESFYVTREMWDRTGPLHRVLLQVNQTLGGRLLIGPLLASEGLYGNAIRQIMRGDRDTISNWLHHAAGSALVILWLVAVADYPVWLYIISAYMGISLVLLRSYAEHRPAREIPHRICINDAEKLMGLLFLNNNLHAVHHARPAMAWFDLPLFYRMNHAEFRQINGDFTWNGYRELFRKYLFRMKEDPVHPYFDSNHCQAEKALLKG